MAGEDKGAEGGGRGGNNGARLGVPARKKAAGTREREGWLAAWAHKLHSLRAPPHRGCCRPLPFERIEHVQVPADRMVMRGGGGLMPRPRGSLRPVCASLSRGAVGTGGPHPRWHHIKVGWSARRVLGGDGPRQRLSRPD